MKKNKLFIEIVSVVTYIYCVLNMLSVPLPIVATFTPFQVEGTIKISYG